ncbi:MAG TPA: transglycosylase domain-containing protein [Anaerolineales bacterium]|nr:transglycosylase domain-containing protein [Anaerolineales bacterium]
MPSAANIVRARRDRRRQQQDRRTGFWRLGTMTVAGVLSIALAVAILVVAVAYVDLTRDLPNVQYLAVLLDPRDGLLLQPTRLYDRTGEHLLQTLAPTDSTRRYLPLNPENPQHLPQALADSLVVLADPGFWVHGGFSMKEWSEPTLHPTLAQGLVSDLLLQDETPSIRRALRERILAAQATRQFGRTQILEWTLNSADFGNRAFGVEAAAQLYLGKSAAELTLGESALLAAVARAPALNPIDAPAQALERRNTTIELLRAFGRVSDSQAAAALAEPAPSPQGLASGNSAVAPAFLRLVLSQLDQQFSRTRLERGGLRIITTLDLDLQQQAACTTLTFASRLEGAGDPSTPCVGADRLPPLPPDARVPSASASAVILDPQTGQVLAAVGETLGDLETSQLNAHDPGSLQYPFVYLTSFTRGFSPASMVWDIPPAGEALVPGVRYLGPVRMRIALASDLEAPAQALITQMGADAIRQTESSFGLQAGAATTLDAAAAYGILAANGMRYGAPGPTTVLTVEGSDHTVWLDLESPQAQPVVDTALAYLMDNVLSDVTARQPLLGNLNPLDIERPVGAKLGRTATGSEAWAVGYTPSRVTAVWVGGRLDDSTLGRSPRIAASLWNALMRLATQDLPADGWLVPAGITAVDVCDPSGMLPTRDCPSVVSEIFLSGNEPTQSDTLFRKVAVNRDTGLLATVFTPAQLVEERVFMQVPEAALEWAKSSNIAIAPTSYDAIQAAPIDPSVNITSPDMFAVVNGQVQIQGTAFGEDFQRYRVLVGKGLNPQEWTTVGNESIDPVERGLLATWDTTGLNGLYAIQLQVIRSDQRVDTAVIQVTVGGS